MLSLNEGLMRDGNPARRVAFTCVTAVNVTEPGEAV